MAGCGWTGLVDCRTCRSKAEKRNEGNRKWMTLSRKMRRGPERKFLIAFTFRMQNEGWVDKVQGRFFFFLKQRKKEDS